MRPDATAKVQHASKHATLLSKRHAAEMSKLIRVKKKKKTVLKKMRWAEFSRNTGTARGEPYLSNLPAMNSCPDRHRTRFISVTTYTAEICSALVSNLPVRNSFINHNKNDKIKKLQPTKELRIIAVPGTIKKQGSEPYGFPLGPPVGQ